MKTRNGKIARLPLEIREQLNTRLADGEPGNRLVEWLNANPAVTKILREQFAGRPMTENNLSEWRAGGYEEWLLLRSFLDEARVLSENAGQVAGAGATSEHLHLVLIAHHAHLLRNLEITPEAAFTKKVDALKKLTASIMNMRRAETQEARVQLQRERLDLQREKHSLKSASSTKTAASTSNNARPDPAETRQAPKSRSTSGPAFASTTESSSNENATPALFAPASKAAPKIPILTGRIQPEFPDLSVRLSVSRDWPDSAVLGPMTSDFRAPISAFPFQLSAFPLELDSAGLTRIHPQKLAA